MRSASSSVANGRLRRIVVVNLTRLGDLLQTSPTIAGLHAVHPDAQVTLVAEKNFAEVCESIPGVDRVHRIDLDRLGHLLLEGPTRIADAYRHVREMVDELRAEDFELALNFSSSRMSAVLLSLLRVPDVSGWAMTSDAPSATPASARRAATAWRAASPMRNASPPTGASRQPATPR